MNSALVTGGAGFIGSHLAKRLQSNGWNVTVADNLSTGSEHNIPRGCCFIKIDLGQKDEYSIFHGEHFDAICHLAGQSSGEASFLNPSDDFASHVMSTFLLLEMCKEKKIKRFLYASSMAVYGDAQYLPVDELHPTNPKTYYAAGKLAAESYIKFFQTLGIDTTIFRLFSVYGPHQKLENKMQGMVSIYLSYILENKPIVVRGRKERFRDFIFVDDVTNAWLKALEDPNTFGKLYNLGTGIKTTVDELVKIELEVLGKKDYPVEFLGNTPGDQFGIVCDKSKVAQELSWSANVTLQEGIKRMIHSYI